MLKDSLNIYSPVVGRQQEYHRHLIMINVWENVKRIINLYFTLIFTHCSGELRLKITVIELVHKDTHKTLFPLALRMSIVSIFSQYSWYVPSG